MNIYTHKSGPVSKAFLQVITLTDTPLVEVADQESADIILLIGADDLWALYNENQLFCVLQEPRRQIAPNQPENVCVIDTLRIFDADNGLTALLAQIEKRKAAAKTENSAPEMEIPKPSDLASFRSGYSVLVIDDTTQNLRIAEVVLAGHQVTVASSVQEGMTKLGQQHFDAVLTDMEMPPDKHYPALSLVANYPVGTKVPYGFAVVFEVTQRGVPVAVVTDGNHHAGWVSAMFDQISRATVNGQKVLFFNTIGKRWDKALKQLMEG